jgi:hypothetical protein
MATFQVMKIPMGDKQIIFSVESSKRDAMLSPAELRRLAAHLRALAGEFDNTPIVEKKTEVVVR